MNLKEISYNIVSVSLVKNGGEQHKEEYRKINPMEQVPSLVIDGRILIESISIMEYLEETRPQISLLPKCVGERAKVIILTLSRKINMRFFLFSYVLNY